MAGNICNAMQYNNDIITDDLTQTVVIVFFFITFIMNHDAYMECTTSCYL